MNTLGTKIRYLRKHKGMTQTDLVGDRITRNQLSMIEKGVANPSMSTLRYIAERLETNVAYLLSEEAYTMEECQYFLSQCRKWMDNHAFTTLIKNAEQFLDRIEDKDAFKNKDMLGHIYNLLGSAYYKVTDKCDLEMLDTTHSLEYICQALSLSYAICYRNNNHKKAEDNLLKANEVLKQINSDNILLKLDVLYNLILNCLQQKKYEEAVHYIHTHLEYGRIHEIYRDYGSLNMILAVVARRAGSYSDALKYSKKAAGYFKLIENTRDEHRCFIHIAVICRLQKDSQSALKYIQKAINYFEENNDIKLFNEAKAEKIKLLFSVHKDAAKLTEQINSVIYSQAISPKDKAELTAILRLGQAETGDMAAALRQLEQSEKELTPFGDSEMLPHIWRGMSKIYKDCDKTELAYGYLLKANEGNGRKTEI